MGDPSLKQYLSRGLIPVHLAEEFRLVAPDSLAGVRFQHILMKLARRLAPGRDFRAQPVRFALMDQAEGNACCLKHARPVLIGFTKGYLDPAQPCAIQNDAELAAVLVHEGLHEQVALKSKPGRRGSKLEEYSADIASIHYLAEAGFDPRALLTHFRRQYAHRGNGAGWLDVIDEHPITENRIMALEAALTAYERQWKGTLDPARFSGAGDTEILSELGAVAKGGRHCGFIEAWRLETRYDAFGTVGKLDAVGELLRSNPFSVKVRDYDLARLLHELDIEPGDRQHQVAVDRVISAIMLLYRPERNLHFKELIGYSSETRYLDRMISFYSVLHDAAFDPERSAAWKADDLHHQFFLDPRRGYSAQRSLLGPLKCLGQAAEDFILAESRESAVRSASKLLGLAETFKSQWDCDESNEPHMRFLQELAVPRFPLPRDSGEPAFWQPHILMMKEGSPAEADLIARGLSLLGVAEARLFRHAGRKALVAGWKTSVTDSWFETRHLLFDEEGRFAGDTPAEAINRKIRHLLENPLRQELRPRDLQILMMESEHAGGPGPLQIGLLGLKAAFQDPSCYAMLYGALLASNRAAQQEMAAVLREWLSGCRSVRHPLRAVENFFLGDYDNYQTVFSRRGDFQSPVDQPLVDFVRTAALPSELKLKIYTANSRPFRAMIERRNCWLQGDDELPGGWQGYLDDGQDFEALARAELHALWPGYPASGASNWPELAGMLDRVLPLMQVQGSRGLLNHFLAQGLAISEALHLNARSAPSLDELCSFLERTTAYGTFMLHLINPTLLNSFGRLTEGKIDWSSDAARAIEQWRVLKRAALIKPGHDYQELDGLIERVEREKDPLTALKSLSWLLGKAPLDRPATREKLLAVLGKSLSAFGIDDGSADFTNRVCRALFPLCGELSAEDRASVCDLAARRLEAQPLLSRALAQQTRKLDKGALRKANLACAGADAFIGFGVASLERAREITGFLLQKPGELDLSTYRKLVSGMDHKLYGAFCAFDFERFERSAAPHEGRYASYKEAWRLEQLRNFHSGFWRSNAGLRALLLREICLPVSLSAADKQQGTAHILEKAFPAGCAESGAARELSLAYAAVAPAHQQPILLSAVLAARNPYEDRDQRVGQILGTVLPALGPGEQKLCQVIQSYPGTDPQIARDLVPVMYHAEEPAREVLVDLYEKLPAAVRRYIAHLGQVEGAGAFFVSLSVILKNGGHKLLQFLRPGARERSESGLRMMRDTAALLSRDGKLIDQRFAGTLADLCARTERHWKDELDHELCRRQMITAYERYSRARVYVDGHEYRFLAPALVTVPDFGPAIGPEFRLMDFIPGPVFVQAARAGGVSEELLAQHAMAFSALELSARMAGLECDLDCHGGNAKIVSGEGTVRVLGRYDFGGFSRQRPSGDELACLGSTMREASRLSGGLREADAFTNSYYEAVSKLSRGGAGAPAILTDVQKQLVSLCDFLKEIEGPALQDVFRAALAHAHPAFLGALGVGRLESSLLKLRGNRVKVILDRA